jgi:hypothetical protein
MWFKKWEWWPAAAESVVMPGPPAGALGRDDRKYSGDCARRYGVTRRARHA